MGDRAVLIMVLPIGGSKSILFMAPAVMEDSSMSIMVVPFVVLIDDLVAWAKALEINCIQWHSSRHDGMMIEDGLADKMADVQLVVVSADIAGSNEFINYTESI